MPIYRPQRAAYPVTFLIILRILSRRVTPPDRRSVFEFPGLQWIGFVKLLSSVIAKVRQVHPSPDRRASAVAIAAYVHSWPSKARDQRKRTLHSHPNECAQPCASGGSARAANFIRYPSLLLPLQIARWVTAQPASQAEDSHCSSAV